MTAKDDLRALVDQLSAEEAAEVLAYAHWTWTGRPAPGAPRLHGDDAAQIRDAVGRAVYAALQPVSDDPDMARSYRAWDPATGPVIQEWERAFCRTVGDRLRAAFRAHPEWLA